MKFLSKLTQTKWVLSTVICTLMFHVNTVNAQLASTGISESRDMRQTDSDSLIGQLGVHGLMIILLGFLVLGIVAASMANQTPNRPTH